MPLKGHTKTTGFTLIELMIAIAIIGILASIALPSYKHYVQKGSLRAAQADIVALSLAIENVYQRTLSYPVLTDAGLDDIKNTFTSWSPSSDPDEVVFTVTSTAATYMITATPSSTSNLVGCVMTMDQDNNQTLSSGTGCNHGTEWF